MTDATGKTPTNGAPQPAKGRRPMAAPKAGDARVSPVIPSMSDSLSSEFGSEGASSVAKPKSPTASPSTSPSAPTRKSDAKPSGATLSEEDSLLLTGLDQAAERAQALCDWALIRREEATDAVRTHPLGSSVIVFAAGMIFGLLLARR